MTDDRKMAGGYDGIGVDDDHEEMQSAADNFFKMPGTAEQSEAAMRSKRKIKITIAVVVILAIALVVAAYFVLSARQQERHSNTISDSQTITESDIDDSTSVVSTVISLVEIPDLVSLFGLSVDDAVSELGDSFVEESRSDESEDGSVTVTLAYADESESDDSSANLVVTLVTDSDGMITSVRMDAGLDTVGISETSFANLVSGPDVIDGLLLEAGVDGGVESYSAPSEDSYTTYEDPESEDLVISQESATFSGDTGISDGPGSWELVFTFDYAQGDDSDPTRTVRITIS